MKFNQRRLLQVFVPVVYSVIMLLVVFYMWRGQYLVRQGGDGPLYRNLREYPAWIRHGFDPAAISFLDDTQITAGIFLAFIGKNWEIF